MNLENAILEGKEEWQLEYQLTELLNLTRISAKSLYGAALKMKVSSFFIIQM